MSMRKRQEVQKVSRRTAVVVLALLGNAALSGAAVLPDQFGEYKRAAIAQVDVSDRPVWDEYGFKTAERADFGAGDRKVNVTVWQMKDTTGALAALQWLQPGVIQHGNYVLRLEGQIADADLTQLKSKLPKVDRAANPSLPAFLPAAGRVKNSERYILGPVSLAQFEPRVSPGLAGFDKGAEASLPGIRFRPEKPRCCCFPIRLRRSRASASASSNSIPSGKLDATARWLELCWMLPSTPTNCFLPSPISLM